MGSSASSWPYRATILESDISHGPRATTGAIRFKCRRVFRADGGADGLGELRGQAVRPPCAPLLCVWQNPDRGRKWGDATAGSFTGAGTALTKRWSGSVQGDGLRTGALFR